MNCDNNSPVTSSNFSGEGKTQNDSYRFLLTLFRKNDLDLYEAFEELKTKIINGIEEGWIETWTLEFRTSPRTAKEGFSEKKINERENERMV